MGKIGKPNPKTGAIAVQDLAKGQPNTKSHLIRSYAPMKVFGHRGASAHFPENSMQSFQAAKNWGADGIELDVQLVDASGSPTVIVLHDDSLRRTAVDFRELESQTFLDRPVEQLKVDLVRSVNIGTMNNPEPPPTLASVLQWNLTKTPIPLLVEVKGNDQKIVPVLCKIIAETIDQFGEGLVYRNMNIISFDINILELIRHELPMIPTFLVVERHGEILSEINKAQSKGITGVDLEVDENLVQYAPVAISLGLRLAVWINRSQGTDGDTWAKKMSQLGVEIFTSDLPNGEDGVLR